MILFRSPDGFVEFYDLWFQWNWKDVHTIFYSLADFFLWFVFFFNCIFKFCLLFFIVLNIYARRTFSTTHTTDVKRESCYSNGVRATIRCDVWIWNLVEKRRNETTRCDTGRLLSNGCIEQKRIEMTACHIIMGKSFEMNRMPKRFWNGVHDRDGMINALRSSVSLCCRFWYSIIMKEYL